MKTKMVGLVLAAVLVCIIAAIAVNTTGLKETRNSLKGETTSAYETRTVIVQETL